MTPRWCDQRRNDGPRTQFHVLTYGKDSQHLRVKDSRGCRQQHRGTVMSVVADACFILWQMNNHCYLINASSSRSNARRFYVSSTRTPPAVRILPRREVVSGSNHVRRLSQHQNDTDKRLLYLIHIEFV
jgi:hypothetical protein